MTPKYYAKLLERLCDEIKTKRPKFGKTTILLQQNDTSVQESIVAKSTLHKHKIELLPHSAYWPDLAPTTFHLFANLEKEFNTRSFSTDKAIIEAIGTYFENLDECSFMDGINQLEQRWRKCIEANGDYFEEF